MVIFLLVFVLSCPFLILKQIQVRTTDWPKTKYNKTTRPQESLETAKNKQKWYSQERCDSTASVVFDGSLSENEKLKMQQNPIIMHMVRKSKNHLKVHFKNNFRSSSVQNHCTKLVHTHKWYSEQKCDPTSDEASRKVPFTFFQNSCENE